MLIFIFTEAMLFAGLISAHTITRASSAVGWPPPGQPRLPVENTAVNTAALLLSGVALLYRAARVPARSAPRAFVPLVVGDRARRLLRRLPGRRVGTADRRGPDAHLEHARRVLLPDRRHPRAARRWPRSAALGWAAVRLRRSVLPPSTLGAAALFWYFVVGVWPIIYLRVYL